MRFKYYLRGIGLGILFATIVMTVAYEIHKSDVKMSDTNVIARAEELGMEFPDDSISGDDALNNTETTEATEVTEASESGEEAAADSQAVTDDGQTDDAAADETADDTDTDGATSEDGSGNVPDMPEMPDMPEVGADATVTVSGGTTWHQIADDLVSQGIITDADDFYTYVLHNANGKNYHTGTFTIPAGSDYDTIISIITS